MDIAVKFARNGISGLAALVLDFLEDERRAIFVAISRGHHLTASDALAGARLGWVDVMADVHKKIIAEVGAGNKQQESAYLHYVNNLLTTAVSHNRLKAMNFAHRWGAQLSPQLMTIAAGLGAVCAIRLLLRWEVGVLPQAFKVAARNNHVGALRVLVENCGNVASGFFRDLFHIACVAGSVEVLDYLRDTCKKVDADAAIRSKRPVMFRSLAVGHVRRKRSSVSPTMFDLNCLLYKTAEKGHPAAIPWVISAGATELIRAAVIASESGNHAVLSKLKECCDRKASESKRTNELVHALPYLTDIAAQRDQPKILELLRDWSREFSKAFGVAELNRLLHTAARFGSIEVLQTLREWGATDFNGAANAAYAEILGNGDPSGNLTVAIGLLT